MLDQLDLWEEMAQQGWVNPDAGATYYDGKQVQPLADLTAVHLRGTYFNFWMNLRLKYSEDIFRARVAALGPKVQAPVRLVGLQLDEDAADDYKVRATLARPDGKSWTVRARYIVGCDGARSAVRELAGIGFDGAEKEDHWVRVDGVVRTNIPDARSAYIRLESKTHGQVLWAQLDHGATRVGFALSPELYAKYGQHMTQEDAVKEAKAAVAPFELEFDQVDWHTVYTIKQFIAVKLQDRERILLAGDAAHAHSSGTAQGMNTGVHDAVSLAWRLAGVLTGMYKPDVLQNYHSERHGVARHLIGNDKTIAELISGRRPERFKDRPEDNFVLFSEFIHAEWDFTMGMGISYPASLLNDVTGSSPPIGVVPGYRFPDAMLQKPGFRAAGHTVRLHEITEYTGKFHILIFAGDPRSTKVQLGKLRRDVDEHVGRFQHAVEFRTIICGRGPAHGECLGVEPFGWAYWDVNQSVHGQYDIPYKRGVIAVLRPDGILGFVAPLDGFERVVTYLERLIIPRKPETMINGATADIGELINADENNLYYKRINGQDVPESVEQGTVKSVEGVRIS